MKKGLKITALTLGALLLLVVAAAIIIPVAFKDKIREKVEAGLNDMLTARLSFGDYRLNLFRAFPNASFSVDNLNVTGTAEFEGDTLAAVKSVGIVINLRSLFSDSGYEIKSIVIDRPEVNAIVNSDGRANWDIMKESAEVQEQQPADAAQAEEVSTGLNLMLRRFAIDNGKITFSDNESDVAASVSDLDFLLSGNMSGSQTGLDLEMKASGVSFAMDKIAWLTGADVSFIAGIDALFDSMKFTLRDNTLKINDILLNFSGTASMPGDDIGLDMVFNAPETSFKSLLSLVPAFYMKGYEDLAASGTVSLGGAVRGIYSEADSTLPDVALNLQVTDGVISYPALPEKITAINITGKVQTDGREMDNTTADISRFHFELAGNPFDMSLSLATPISDPAVAVAAKGKIDLSKLQQAIPLDSIDLNGLLDVSLDLAGRMSMIENEEYEKFRAAGTLNIADMSVVMTDMPDLRISNAALKFSPAYAELTGMKATMGKGSDLALSGKLENYIPYLFSDGTVRGNLSLRSDRIDLNEIMDIIPSDTSGTDTTAMEMIKIPGNIDFNLDALVSSLTYGRLSANDVRGDITVRDGTVTISETGMKALGGSLLVNAVYDSRDSLIPKFDAGMMISSVNIREAFDAFNTVRQLMPAASGLGGTVSVKIDFSSVLGKNMMPLLNSLSGNGELTSQSVQILGSKSFDRMKSVLKMNPAYTNIVKDLRATFIINDGRLWVKPFDIKVGNIKLNISGDQGLDRTLHYLVRAEIPRAELGDAAGSLMSSLASQAAALGFGAEPPDVIKVNLNVGGTVLDPAITPSFAGGNIKSVAAAAADTVKQEVVEKVNEAARQQADKIINEAEENAKVIREKAASSAEVMCSEADLRGKKLIKDAEAKGPIAVAAAKKAADVLNREADKKATQLVTEANIRADQILSEARTKADELLK